VKDDKSAISKEMERDFSLLWQITPDNSEWADALSRIRKVLEVANETAFDEPPSTLLQGMVDAGYMMGESAAVAAARQFDKPVCVECHKVIFEPAYGCDCRERGIRPSLERLLAILTSLPAGRNYQQEIQEARRALRGEVYASRPTAETPGEEELAQVIAESLLEGRYADADDYRTARRILSAYDVRKK
jgi:hypothetical protein